MFLFKCGSAWCTCLIYCVVFVTFFVLVNAQDSPCPTMFEYAWDQQQRLYGRIKIDNPIGNNIILNVELSVGNSVQDYNGNIELAYSRSKAVDEIINGRPLYYNVFFPYWKGFPPRITKILLNGNLICFGPPLDIKRVPVLTTINLQHSLKISSLSLGSTNYDDKPPSRFPNGNFIEPGQRQPFDSPNKESGNFYFQFGAPQNPSQNYPNNPFLVNSNGGGSTLQNNPFLTNSNSGGSTLQNNPFLTNSNSGGSTSQNNPFLNFFNNNNNNKPNNNDPRPNNSHQGSGGASFFDIIDADLPENPFQLRPPKTTTTTPATTTTRITTKRTPTRRTTTTTTTTEEPFEDEEPYLPDIDVRGNLNEVCGKSLNANSLIANGEAVAKGFFPWLVALYSIKQLNLVFSCGATLVSHKHVITAAHCLRPREKRLDIEEILIIIGKYNIQRWTNDNSVRVGAKKVAVHPAYHALTADADIAVITLQEAVEFKGYVRPICLWSEEVALDKVVGETGIVAGWSKDENGVAQSPVPKQVTLPIVTQEECLRSHDDFAGITSERTFCAGFRNGSGPCSGDSGGGFMMKRNGRWTLRGIVSMSLADQGRRCDLSQYLVFTDVSKFLNWIRDIIKQ